MSVRFCVVIVERIKDARPPTYRPPLPQHDSHGVPPTILTLMKQCWDEEPAQRPTFDEVAKALKSINKGKSASLTTAAFLQPSYSTTCVSWRPDAVKNRGILSELSFNGRMPLLTATTVYMYSIFELVKRRQCYQRCYKHRLRKVGVS